MLKLNVYKQIENELTFDLFRNALGDVCLSVSSSEVGPKAILRITNQGKVILGNSLPSSLGLILRDGRVKIHENE